jgi:hypothetical protein
MVRSFRRTIGVAAIAVWLGSGGYSRLLLGYSSPEPLIATNIVRLVVGSKESKRPPRIRWLQLIKLTWQYSKLEETPLVYGERSSTVSEQDSEEAMAYG